MINSIIQGDCLEIMKQIPDGSIDCIITDPPYGINENHIKNLSRETLARPKDYGVYEWDKQRIEKEYFDKMRQISRKQIIFGGNYYTDYLPVGSFIVWDKLNGENDFADCELAWVSTNQAIRKIKYLWNGMIKQHPEQRFHPTQKPINVMIWIIRNYTKPNDLILDPFLGSGTTAVAALRTGRRFIGIELSEEYCAIARKRVDHELSQPRLDLFPTRKGEKEEDPILIKEAM